MKKHAAHSLVNIFGLVLGMTACLLMGLYVAYERSFDEFHTNKENIFRIRHDRYTNHELTRQFSAGPMGIGDDLKRTFPEVVKFTRLNGTQPSVILSEGDTRFKQRVMYASEDFFEVLSYKLISGVDSTVLKEPFTMVISESLGKKFFGDNDPVGRSLKSNGKHEYLITGVFKDIPDNTHLKFDALLSFPSLHKIIGPTETDDLMNNWGWEGNYTYVEMAPGTDMQDFAEKVQVYVDRETEEFSKKFNEQMSFVFLPITSLHLGSDTKDEPEVGGSETLVNFLSVISGFILLISWINYINLATAKAVERAREVGIRKVLGTQRNSLVIQFIMESFFMMAIALVMTLAITVALLPSFSAFVERQLNLQILVESWPGMLIVFILGIVCAGVYPAFVMSGFKPALVLKGTIKSSNKGINLRRGLVAFQFIASIVLITGTIGMYSQVNFMKDRPLGMNHENVMVINGPNVHEDDQRPANKLIHESLAAWPFVLSSTSSGDVPGHPVRSGTFALLEGKSKKEVVPVRVVSCDENYTATYGLNLLAGRNFNGSVNEEWKSAMVNESAMKLLGFLDVNEIVGKRIIIWENTLTVVGVIKDYHHESLKRQVDQLIFVCDRSPSDFISIKFSANADPQQLMSAANDAFNSAFPENIFTYFFMDDYFIKQYKSEVAFNRITGMFAILATLISCLGLFGLSSYMIIQRTKEIGIRKVLGATAKQIILLMSKEYVVIILASNLVAWPIAYLLMNEWLSGFAYRINFNIVMFIVPGICALFIAFGTIAGQAMKASTENPVKSLKSE